MTLIFSAVIKGIAIIARGLAFNYRAGQTVHGVGTGCAVLPPTFVVVKVSSYIV